MNKEKLRSEMIEKRKKLSSDEKALKDKILREKLFATEEYQNAKTIFVYVNMKDEISTKEIIERALKDNKRVAVPKILKNPKRMEALEIKSIDELTCTGSFGILEPNEDVENLNLKIDLTIVPGLAFDKECSRVGYGGGFYDKFFEMYDKSEKIALCYSFQVVTHIDFKEYDKKVDMIITTQKDYIINKKINEKNS